MRLTQNPESVKVPARISRRIMLVMRKPEMTKKTSTPT
jgi:hypothetical protein